MKRYTLADIGKLAGVSPKTVSRVINNDKYVKDETRKKILKIIDETGYYPNNSAKSLVTRKTKTIGLIVGDIENPYYSRLARGVIRAAESYNYSVIVCESRFEEATAEKYLKMLMERSVDGILISTLDFKSSVLDKLKMNGFPHIFVTCKLSSTSTDYVIGDDYQGEREATEYLINLGHRNIAFLRGPNMFPANQKLLAYKDVMKESNIQIKDYFISRSVYDHEGGHDVTLELLSNHKDITAILAINDIIAIGAIEAIDKLGLSVPEDISIIGCDNIDVTKLLKVPLTTINYPKLRCGNIATKILIDALEGRTIRKKKEVILGCKLIVRKSCAPLKSA